MTVRFTYRKNKIRIIGTGFWRKGKIKYTDEPGGKMKVISDFLPSPEELALKDETAKVTINLSKASVEFFKNEAKNIIPNIKK